MRSYRNPFRSRASEQFRDTIGFLSHVGEDILDLLNPDVIWDRPLILRSAPGGGKTTLLRLLSIDSLVGVSGRRVDFRELTSRLGSIGAIDDTGPLRLGIFINLGHDYRTLASCGAPSQVGSLLFLRLLDARIMASAIRAVLTSRGLEYPQQAHRVTVEFLNSDERADEAARRLGGTVGSGILQSSKQTESKIVELVDSLLPVDWLDATAGHAELYSLRYLSDARFFIDGIEVRGQPLLLLDDGHDLTDGQRTVLLQSLLNRTVRVARWYAERLEALAYDDVFADATPERDYTELEVERASRQRHTVPFSQLLTRVAGLRADHYLQQYTGSERKFFEYLAVASPPLSSEIEQRVRESVTEIAGSNRTHLAWLDRIDSLASPEDRALEARSIQILIERDRARPQQRLFEPEDEPSADPPTDRATLKSAARLLLCAEHDLPFYHGKKVLSTLASQNVEQYLRICGEIFEFMLGRITLNRSPEVDARSQDKIIRALSHHLWQELPSRLPTPVSTMRLLVRIAEVGRENTFSATASYAPGVTGIAMTMNDVETLRDRTKRARVPGADDLYGALATAITRNLLVSEPNYSVKGRLVTVFSLNRLLCPAYSLPLTWSGFRERPLREVAAWTSDETDLAQLERV